MSHDLTRWIELADERRFGEATMFERPVCRLPERHHLEEIIAKVANWLHALTRSRFHATRAAG